MTPFSIREARSLIRGVAILGTVLEAILEFLKNSKSVGNNNSFGVCSPCPVNIKK